MDEGEIKVEGRGGTHHLGRDAHGLEFLLVVGARFGAVVCHEDDLLS